MATQKEKLSYVTYVRFTEPERTILERKASEYGMTVSSVIRMYVKRGMKGNKK